MSATESLDLQIQRFESQLNTLDPNGNDGKDTLFKFFTACGFFEQVIKKENIDGKGKPKWKKASETLTIDFSQAEIQGLKSYCENLSKDNEISWTRLETLDGYYKHGKFVHYEKYKESDSDEYKLLRTIYMVRNSLFYSSRALKEFEKDRIETLRKAYSALAKIIEDNQAQLHFNTYIAYTCSSETALT